ncbi:MAG: hypothetical protein ABI554_14015 [Flavobacterium sp.]
MKLENNLEGHHQQKMNSNGEYGILALLLILINGCSFYNLLMSLNQDSNMIKRLWKPDEIAGYLAVPTYIFLSIIIVWIIAPKNTQMKIVFKTVGIITIVLYTIYLLLFGYALALGSSWKN